MELCKAARRVESCFGYEFVRRVCAEGEERGEACDECGVPVRLMTMGRMSTSVPGQWLRMAFARGVCLARIKWAVWERLWSNTSIPLSEIFKLMSNGGDRLCDRRIEVRGGG
jgi:hypothetical protein